jgi:hypothetical protein
MWDIVVITMKTAIYQRIVALCISVYQGAYATMGRNKWAIFVIISLSVSRDAATTIQDSVLTFMNATAHARKTKTAQVVAAHLAIALFLASAKGKS